MVRIPIRTRPNQPEISRDRLREMITWAPRRFRLSDWVYGPLNPPDEEGKDWWVLLPFCETFKNAFITMVGRNVTSGLRATDTDRCHAFVPGSPDEVLDDIREWETTVGSYVGQRDCLALSFSLNFGREDGNPEEPVTEIGTLRSRAKPYGRDPQPKNYRAANQLGDKLLSFLDVMDCYDSAEVVTSVPPSDPTKPFDLSAHLAERVASNSDLRNGAEAIVTERARPSAKEVALDRKLEILEGSVRVDADFIEGSNVLLIDDLYQSGTSMNFVGMRLLEEGANRVYGLACEKTCSNDSNVVVEDDDA